MSAEALAGLAGLVPLHALFNWESAAARRRSRRRAGGGGLQSVYGATLLGYANDSDFALLELEEMPPPWYGAYLNGWAAHAAPPNRTAVIHHPSGDLKKVSLDFDAPEEAYYPNDAAGGCGVVRGEHRCWRHRDWRAAATRWARPRRLVGRAAL